MVILVGIVGGIGSGKSAVAAQFQRLGAEVLDGDRLGHEVLRQSEVIDQLHRRWGDRVLVTDENGGIGQPAEIDRSAVARIVFAETPEAETELRYLERVVHPRIRETIRQRIEAFRNAQPENGTSRVVILDAPVMIEAGWHQLCDYLIFVDCPREIRRQRVLARGWTAKELAARQSRQLPPEQKRKAADWIVDNSGTLPELAEKIEPIWRRLTLPKSP